jgi:hypothetical protein
VSVTPPDATGSAALACAHLVNYLPARLDGHHTRVVEPRSPLVHAWGSPPIVMRCGVPEPAGYSRSSPQTAFVDGVAWFQDVGSTDVTWTAIRKSAYVALIVPRSYEGQGGLLVELGAALKRALP